MITDKSLISQFKNNYFVIIEVLICCIIVYATILRRPDIVSMAFTLSFVSLLVIFLFTLIKNDLDENSKLLIFIVIVSIINILISTFMANFQVSFTYLQNYFIFLSTIIFFVVAQNYKVSKATENLIYFVNAIIALAYPYCNRFITMTTNHSNETLAFNFSNPNLAGMFIFLSVLYMILGVIRYKNIVVRIGFLVLTIVDLDLLLKTGSRNGLISLIVFAGILVFAYIQRRNFYKNWILAFFSYLPAVFVPVYLFFINTVIEKGWFSSLVSEGKKLNSRERVWYSFFNRLDGKWLTGNYPYAAGNAHNSHMVLLCSFGAVVLIMVICLVYKVLIESNKKCKTFYDFSCLSAFIASLLMGMGEGALYSGGMGIYIFCGVFLVLANSSLGDDKVFENNGNGIFSLIT